MRDSWFYRWGSFDLKGYLQPLVVLWGIGWLITGPIVSASFAPSRYPLHFALLSFTAAFVLPILALAQLYIGWLHIGQRLQQALVPYEESGWYDGQVWQKPEETLNRDRLVMDYQVKPILQRVKYTLSIILGLGVALITTWQVL